MEIQKLTIQKLTIAGKKYEYPDTTALVGKINELVDAVNELQKQIDKMSCAILDLATPNGENKALESIKAESNQSDCPEQMGYIKLDSDSLATFLKIHPQYNKNGVLELDRTRKALEKAKLVLVDLRDHAELDAIQEWDVYETLSEITALEQKDK